MQRTYFKLAAGTEESESQLLSQVKALPQLSSDAVLTLSGKEVKPPKKGSQSFRNNLPYAKRQRKLLTMPTPKTFIIFVFISLIFLIIQLYAIKYVLERMNSTRPLEELPPWDTVKLFLSKCEMSGLTVFVIEPSLLRAVREGSKRRTELWNVEHHDIVTFGVIDPGLDLLHLVMSAMKHHNFDWWEKSDPDPRGLTPTSRRSYRSVTTHHLLWVPVEGYKPMLIHLVIFYKRGNFLWHAPVQDKLHSPPFSVANSIFGKTAGSYNVFDLTTVVIDGTKLQFPSDSYTFLKEIETSEFIECNHTESAHFYAKYPPVKSKNEEVFKRKARQLLSTAKNVLDSMGIPFWLSSGTCLGWYRQCDIISHSTDVDIGIFIKDYREELISLMENSGLVLTHHFGKISDSLELSFLYGDLKLDIFFFYITDKHIWNGGTQASTGKKYKYIFPPFNLCWTEFLELWIRVPCPPGPYIHANYGPNWKRPETVWDWKKSPNNVVENGKWPESEWDEVIQLYG